MSTTTLDDRFLTGARVRSWAMPVLAIATVGHFSIGGAGLAMLISGNRTAAPNITALSLAILWLIWLAGIIAILVAQGTESRAMAAGHLPGPAPDQPTRARRMLQSEHLTWLPTTVALSVAGIVGVIYLGYGVTLAIGTAIVGGQWCYVRRLRRRLGVVMNRRFLPRPRS